MGAAGFLFWAACFLVPLITVAILIVFLSCTTLTADALTALDKHLQFRQSKKKAD